MLAFTLRRAIQAIGVMIAVGIIAFSMFRFAGDPVSQIVSIDTSATERAEIRKSLGLDDPVVVQFAHVARRAIDANEIHAEGERVRRHCQTDRQSIVAPGVGQQAVAREILDEGFFRARIGDVDRGQQEPGRDLRAL